MVNAYILSALNKLTAKKDKAQRPCLKMFIFEFRNFDANRWCVAVEIRKSTPWSRL